jgi:Mg-chelatase subunit ChlD
MRLVSQLFASSFPFVQRQAEHPKNEDYVDENGIRTTVEYTINENGKKVKVWPHHIPESAGTDEKCILCVLAVDNPADQAGAAKVRRRPHRR